MKTSEETLKRFYTISGKISQPYAGYLRPYDINNPESEIYLEYCQWEDFHSKKSFKNCFSKDSDYYYPLKNKFSLDDLKESIKILLKDDREYDRYITIVEKNYEKIDAKDLSIDDKKGCCLALTYYTGNKTNSDRINRNVNVLIRGEDSITKEEKWNDGKIIYPVLYYLNKGLAYLPYYSEYTIKCVNLEKEIISEYEEGTIIAWLGFNSCLTGKNPSPFLASRNTIFYIYSFNAKEIPQYNNFSSEKEVIYSPFSHFLIFKKEYKDGQNFIHMRQIEIGLHTNNIIYVDKLIFSSKYESQWLIKEACQTKLDLKIIPKISAECALAFVKSFKDYMIDRNIKYKIVLEYYRYGALKDPKAGDFVKYILENNLNNIEIVVFTFSKKNDIEYDFFKKGIDMAKHNIKIIASCKTISEFLISE